MNKIKDLISAKMPIRVKNILKNILYRYKLYKIYMYDLDRYLSYSSTVNDLNKKKLEAKIIATYHNLEKGLALHDTRLGFGKDTIDQLFSLLNEYRKIPNTEKNTIYLTAVSVLWEYIEFHEKSNYHVADLREKLLYYGTNSGLGGILEVTRDTISNNTFNFSSFVNTRYSIRDFEDKEVDINVLKHAITMAIKTPSVCNRQPWKVYLINNKEMQNKILNIQKGNRGFGDLSNKLLIVTSDLNSFWGIQERNQCFIDGGMFTMSIVYALHSLGLGSCILFWPTEEKIDNKLRKLINLDKSQNIIALIVVGHIPDKLKVAKSNRKTLDDILYILD